MSFSISQEYLNKLQETTEIEGIYLANSLQQGFIYHALNQGNIDDAYIVQLLWQYNSQINVSKLKEAWNYAQKKYPTLRTRFSWEEQLIQVVDKEGNLDWRYIDLSEELDTQAQEFKIREIQEADRYELYELEQGSLFRIYIIKQNESIYTCILSNHHAILDGWSVPILLEFIHETYLKLQVNEKITILIDHSYKDIQRYLQKHRNDNQNYWKEYISQVEERADLQKLSTTATNIRISEYKLIKEPTTQTLIIQGRLYDRLKELSKTGGITLNAIIQYVWHKTLNIFGDTNQTAVGVTVSGRNLLVNNIENSVGLYINTLPLIVNHQIHKTKSIIELIKVIQNDINEINIRSVINLASLQKGGERLFDSLFIYENYPNPTNEEQQNKLKISFKGAVEKLDYPLVVMPYEADNKLIFKITYAGELFSKDTIEYLLLLIKTLLEQIAINPNQQVQNLNYIDQEDYKRIVHKWNRTDKEFPSDKTIAELFEEQVKKTSDSIAVICNNIRLTYKVMWLH